MYGHFAENTVKCAGSISRNMTPFPWQTVPPGLRREGMELPLAADANGCDRLKTLFLVIDRS